MNIVLLALAALVAGATPPSRAAPTADVVAVSVVPATGRAELVIDVRGAVEVSDFVLSNPSRIVVDLVGARLVAPLMQYDGRQRGGIRNVRYAQFRSDVVRVVVELEGPQDYTVHQEDSAVRVAVEGASEPFAVWSSTGRRTATSPASAVVVGPLPAPAGAPSGAAPAPTAPAPAPQPQQVSQQPRISVTFDHATIQEVVAEFATFSGRSMVLGKDITGEVTAEIRDQPWDVALNAILAGQGLAATELPGGIIRVDSRAALAAQDSAVPIRTRIVPINYARASSLAPSVQGMVSVPRGRVVADTVTNAIIVTDLESRLADIEGFIQALDVRTPQVAIQARIVFVDRTELEDLGLRYDLGTSTQFFNDLVQRTDPTTGQPFAAGTRVINLGGNAVSAIANATQQLADGSPALKLIYSTVIGNFTLTSFLEALQSVTLVDIQAEPTVTVADNRAAEIFSGERTPIRQIDVGAIAGGGAAAPRATTNFQPTGIRLQVTPHVVAGTREILMVLHADRSAVTPSTISEIGAVFTTQEATTQLLVRDGETAVIGGLTQTEITVSKSGIPFLVDLPVLGSLFGFRGQKEVRRDLLILVTPHIVDDMAPAGGGAQNR